MAERTSLVVRVGQGGRIAALLTALGGAAAPTVREGVIVLAVCTAAGAVAGAAYHRTESSHARGGWRKTAANVTTRLVFAAAAMAFLALGAARGPVGA